MPLIIKLYKSNLWSKLFLFMRYIPGSPRHRNVPLIEKTILKLQRLDLSYSSALALSRDLFVFSYSTRGMAFVDMAYLKKKI